jgi:hypothetical protein
VISGFLGRLRPRSALKAVTRQASAMLSAPFRRCRLSAVFLKLAMTLGCGAGAHGGAVLVEGDVAHPVHSVFDAPVVAQPGGDHLRVGVFECDAADRVDDLAARSPVATATRSRVI